MKKNLKIQKKVVNVFYLLITNFKNYGINDFFKIIFFEIKNCLIFGFADLFYVPSKSKSGYQFSKDNRESKIVKYDSTYLPTPYFFLEIIKEELKKFNTNKSIFLDFGCGAGRVLNFFSPYYNKLIGIDKNHKYKKFIKKHNQKFIKLDVDKINKLKNIKSTNKKFILYFFNPFDLRRIIKVISFFTKKKDDVLIVTVNCAPLKFKKITKVYDKKFLNRNNSISIYKKK